MSTSANAGPTSGATLRFGDAELDRDGPELRVGGKRVSIGPRALGLLIALLDNQQRPVSKQELLDSVWKGVIVEENNLQVQVSSLRRLLGAEAIATIPGRGYQFMLPLADRPAPEPLPEPEAELARGVGAALPVGNLPRSIAALYGRDDERLATQALLRAHRLVSIVGAAGIGKTRLAIASALPLAGDHPDGVWLIELATLDDPRLLVQTVARAVRIDLPGLRDPADELGAALRSLDALLVIDNCEHLIEEVGTLVARLLQHSQHLRVLATSQEPLRVDDEHVFRLGPLATPADGSAAGAAAYGAVQLFQERVRALQPGFSFDAAAIVTAVEICRRLDGLPLAIELAAARVPLLGVGGVHERLGERFRMLTGGSRVAPKRHQTLRAALDWSHALLDASEGAVYRRLGVFVGSFSIEAAQELAESGDVDGWAVLEILGSLVDKSLVMVEPERRPRYRMLESTREHALQQLAQAGETAAWSARHASVTMHTLQREIKARRMGALLAELGNVRTAFDWATGPTGDRSLAIALATLPAMVMAVDGRAQEARRRLLEVEALVDATVAPELVAQYWQWVGRIGLDGRLPTSRCIAAFERAERLFEALGNMRHVHACRRHLAEAMLDANDLPGAAAALARAQAMETASWPPADRVRRLRIEGLLLAREGRFDEALTTSSRALELAQELQIGRYEFVLLDDIARTHLDADRPHEAALQYRALADRARGQRHAGLTLSNALAGLVAALTAENDLAEASAVANQALPLLRRSGILLARSDILACLAARRGLPELAARLLGASDRFRADCEAPRTPIERRCRAQALASVQVALDDEARIAWMAAGAADREDEIAAAFGATVRDSTGASPAGVTWGRRAG